ncbi:hypothetical protein [Neptunitalea chrysea]|nr:hypothetical protein [Neptunitalea chrysea]
MKNQIYLILSIIFLVTSCASFEPFESRNDMKIAKKKVADKINLSREALDLVTKDGEILKEVTTSIKSDVPSELIARRVDSLLENNYSREELLFMFKMDRSTIALGAEPSEFIRNEDLSKFKKYKSVEDAKKHMDSIMKVPNNKKIND